LLIPLCAVIGRAAININLSLIALSTLIYIIIKKDFFIFKASWFKIAIILWLYLIINSFFAKYPEATFSRALPFVKYPLIALTIQYLFMHDKKIIS